MSSKAQKRRNKRRAKGYIPPEVATNERTGVKGRSLRAVAKRQSMKPTDERRAHGVWVEGKAEQPDVDLASDMAGTLFHRREINEAQLEAARSFQEVRAAFVAELGVSGYRSCLAGGVGGHDDGDGNPEVFRAYRHITRQLTPPQVRVLEVGLDMPPEQAGRLTVWKLRDALDAISA